MRSRVEAREITGKMTSLEVELDRLRALQNSAEEQLRGRRYRAGDSIVPVPFKCQLVRIHGLTPTNGLTNEMEKSDLRYSTRARPTSSDSPHRSQRRRALITLWFFTCETSLKSPNGSEDSRTNTHSHQPRPYL